MLHLLQRQGTVAGVPIYGVNGVQGGLIPPQASGLLDFAFPSHAGGNRTLEDAVAGVFYGEPADEIPAAATTAAAATAVLLTTAAPVRPPART